jgi:predicted PurR-regulated permease PerM
MPDASGRRSLRAFVALGLLIFASWVMWSYVVAVVWGALMAIAIWPAYRRLKPFAPAKRRWLAPFVATMLALLVIGLPVVLALTEIGREAQVVLTWIKDIQQSGLRVPPWVAQLPLLGSDIDRWWRVHLSDPREIASLLGGVSAENVPSWVQSIGGELAYRLLLLLLALMTLFFILREAEYISSRLLAISEQWLGYSGERLVESMVEAVRGVVNGTVIVAVAEGVLIGVGYVILGLPQPYLLAALTIAFAMVPLGAWLVFTVAALVLLVNGGSTIASAGLFGWGVLVMIIGDTMVQPALIGSSARLPVVCVLIGIFGGVETFGLVGLFIGPIIMAALRTIWRDWLI